MGLIRGLSGIVGQFFSDNFANGELWKHLPAYITFAIGGYFMGRGCSQQTHQPLSNLDRRVIEQYESAKDYVSRGYEAVKDKISQVGDK